MRKYFLLSVYICSIRLIKYLRDHQWKNVESVKSKITHCDVFHDFKLPDKDSYYLP